MIKATIKVVRKKGKGPSIDQVIENATKLAGQSTMVKAGFPAGEAPGSIIDIATYNHFGTSHIPARPFITLAMFNHRAEIRDALIQIGRLVVNDGADMKEALGQVGLLAQGVIQFQIASNMPPPNAAVTIKRKGSSNTLIDTGAMRQAVTWDYDE